MLLFVLPLKDSLDHAYGFEPYFIRSDIDTFKRLLLNQSLKDVTESLVSQPIIL